MNKILSNCYLPVFIFLLCLMWSTADRAFGQKNPVISSPDNSIQFNLVPQEDGLFYSVYLDKQPVIELSPLKMIVDENNLGSNASLQNIENYTVDEQYETRPFHAVAHHQSNGSRISVRGSDSDITYTLDVQVFDEGVAFRFIIPENGEGQVPDEATVFNLPGESTVWYHDLYTHYEGLHLKRDIGEIPSGDWGAPPVTYKLPGGHGYAAISEANLKDYPGMALQADGENGFVTRLGHDQPDGYPFAHDYSMEEAQRLAQPVSYSGEITTPWRVVMIGRDLNTMVNNDMLTHLSDPPDPEFFPEGMDTEWVKPGRSVWAWIDGGERSLEGMKEFSRLAGELGFEYNTVDAFWYRWSDEDIRELVEYSAEQGVGVWLWRHGRDIRDREERRAFFERCSRLGVVGMKLDAFSHESKEFIDLYQDVLRDAAEFKLMVNFHGNNKPAGETRPWPNEMTREGIRGLEWGGIQTGWSEHNTTLPFTRFLTGHGDYTPLHFGDRRLETSWSHQIATTIVFSSPVMIYASHPQKMLDHPAADLIKSVPTVWDETVVLPDSKIGEVAAFARRKGDTWYLAILNGEEPKRFQASLSFLDEGWYEGMVVKDRPHENDRVKIEPVFTRNTDTLPVRMNAGGGFVVRFTKVEDMTE